MSAAATGYSSAVTLTEIDNPALDGLEREVTQRITEVGLPGAGLLVIQGGELVQFEAWGGYRLDTIIPIASGSKWLSGVTIMTLVDDGLIDLDMPIRDYVPGADRAPGRTGDITMRQLLSFTSGLRPDDNFACMSDPAAELQQCAKGVLAAGVAHRPGTSYWYGSQHLYVAAAIAELLTGDSFVDLFHERVATPLQMTSTTFAGSGSGGDITDVTNPGPAGTAISTMADYAKFLEMLTHGGMAPDGAVVISSEALVEMERNYTDAVEYLSASTFRRSTRGVYGLAHWIDWTYADGSWMVTSSDGAFGFRPWIDKSNNLFGVYLINDQGNGYVEGDPFATAADAEKVQTSGMWIFRDVAAALGEPLPEDFYAHR